MSDVAAEYRRQFQWRDWRTALETLPQLQGQTLVDLGCGVGDLASKLTARGARVVGFDSSEELIEPARSRGIPNAEFRIADLSEDLCFDDSLDGVWCGFAAAYFIDLSSAIARWTGRLKPGGWIGLTEIDDLFGHGPLTAKTRAC